MLPLSCFVFLRVLYSFTFCVEKKISITYFTSIFKNNKLNFGNLLLIALLVFAVVVVCSSINEESNKFTLILYKDA